MLPFDTDDMRDVFVCAIIDHHLETCNYAYSTKAIPTGQLPKLTDGEIMFCLG